MISPEVLNRLRVALAAGVSDYVAAEIAGCHRNTAMWYRSVLERSGLISKAVVRRDRLGRYYDPYAIGGYKRATGASSDAVVPGSPREGKRRAVWLARAAADQLSAPPRTHSGESR